MRGNCQKIGEYKVNAKKNILFVVLLFVSLFLTGCNEIVAYYKMDECQVDANHRIIKDSSGNNNNAIAEHGPNNTDGKYATPCLDFGAVICNNLRFRGEGYNAPPNNTWYGAQYYLEVPNDYSLSPLANYNEVTINGWFKTGKNGTQTILSKLGEYRVFVENGNLKLNFWNKYGHKYTFNIKSNVNDDKWHFFAVAVEIRQGKLVGNVYYGDRDNDNLVSKNISQKNFSAKKTANNLLIGATDWGNNVTNYFDGFLDEISIANYKMGFSDIYTVYENQRNHKDTDIRGKPIDRRCKCLCGNLRPTVDYHMDECKWDNDSSTYEIKNYGSLGSDYNATALNGANTITNGKICRGGDFRGKYIEPYNYPHLGSRWSMSVWIRFPLEPGQNQFSIDGYYYFIIASVNGKGDLGFFQRKKNTNQYKWGVYDNYGAIKTINIGKISNGWHQVVEVAKNGKTFLYIDGNYIGKVNIYTNGNLKYIGSSTDYTNNETIGSYMDEFELYKGALSKSQIQQIYNNESAGKNYDGTIRTCPACMAIDHYEIWHYPSNLTCQPAPLKIKACANDNCSQLYTDNVTLTLDYDSESKEISFSGGEDNTTISYTQAGTITLSTSNESPAPSNPTICHIFNSSSTTCDIIFKDTGFVFKTPTNSDYVVNNMLSCSAKPIEIDAVQKDNVTNKCTNMSVFNGDVTLNMYGRYITPSTNPYGTKVMIDNTPVETVNNNSTATGTSLTLHFDNGTAQFNLSYPDAGSIEIGAIYDKNGLHVKGESNPFVVKPARFVFDNLSNPADNSTCSTDSCWANIGVFKKAGEIFNFDVKAICDNGTVTPNYYPINQNGDNSTVNMTALMVAPDNGTDATNKLSKTAISASEFSKGSALVKESFGEVGVIDLKFIDSNYLGAGSISANKKVGRFIPYHFVIDNITNGTLKEQCDSFNYIGQTITYDTNPSFYVIAENKDNQTTLNYKGYFFKLKASDIKIGNPQHDDNKTQVSIEIERATPDFKKGNGVGTYTFGSDNVTYVKDNNSKIAPFSPEFHFSIDNAIDSDNVTCANCPDNVTVTGTQMKYGRLKIFNNYGPGNEALTLKVQTQYWNGSQWELNEDDVCTILSKNDFVLENPTGNISDNDTSISSVKGIDTGEGSMTLSPPGLDKYGSIDVDLSSEAIFYNWLYDNNTKGTAFFGIYRGRDRVIEWKEVAP